MTQLANAVTWRPPTKPSAARRLLLAVGLAIAAVILSQYLAAYLFLWWIRADPLSATPLTIARYAYYYGDRDDVSVRLKVASGVGLSLVLLAALPAILPKRRSLHGDARFANGREIARAGLFAEAGFYLGRVGRRDLILGGQQGVLLSAPPRSDKGTATSFQTC